MRDGGDPLPSPPFENHSYIDVFNRAVLYIVVFKGEKV